MDRAAPRSFEQEYWNQIKKQADSHKGNEEQIRRLSNTVFTEINVIAEQALLLAQCQHHEWPWRKQHHGRGQPPKFKMTEIDQALSGIQHDAPPIIAVTLDTVEFENILVKPSPKPSDAMWWVLTCLSGVRVLIPTCSVKETSCCS